FVMTWKVLAFICVRCSTGFSVVSETRASRPEADREASFASYPERDSRTYSGRAAFGRIRDSNRRYDRPSSPRCRRALADTVYRPTPEARAWPEFSENARGRDRTTSGSKSVIGESDRKS